MYNQDSVVALAAPLSLPSPTDPGARRSCVAREVCLATYFKIKADKEISSCLDNIDLVFE